MKRRRKYVKKPPKKDAFGVLRVSTAHEVAERDERKLLVRKMRARGGQGDALEFIKDIPTFRRGQVWRRLTKSRGQLVVKYYAITRQRLTHGWLRVYTYNMVDMLTRPRGFFLKPGSNTALVREFKHCDAARAYVDQCRIRRAA